jgi:hypothetical protein
MTIAMKALKNSTMDLNVAELQLKIMRKLKELLDHTQGTTVNDQVEHNVSQQLT